MIPYGKQSIDENDINAVVDVLKSDFLTQGPVVPKFESAFKDLVSSQYAIAVTNATSALHLACLALGVGEGDAVWTSPISFVASSNCALYCGAKIDFVDIDPITYNLCPEQLEAKLKNARKNGLTLPKVVIPVHMTGQSCDMQSIAKLAKEYGFKIIEDASHAVGAYNQKKPVGSCYFSDICVFSFHPVKIITTGEGGMLTTNAKDISEKIHKLRSHGITRETEQLIHKEQGPWYYEQHDLGFNYRMTDIQAALGLSQLSKLSDFIEKRKQIARTYNKLLKNLNIILPSDKQLDDSSWHLYVIQVSISDHKRIFSALRNKGIMVNLHYIPIYKQPFYQKIGFEYEYCANAETYYKQAITLPIYPGLSFEKQSYIVDQLSNLVV
jgi:UDP-4-amino-4,6-dideoxy-N-acetyl-beta-L-altrosamine transaminase